MASNRPAHRGKIMVWRDAQGKDQVTFQVTGTLFMEGRVWVSHCPALDLSTCGRTREEAMANTREAIQLFFEECLRRGTLEAALRELHWNLTRFEPRLALQTTAQPAIMIDQTRDDGWRGQVQLTAA